VPFAYVGSISGLPGGTTAAAAEFREKASVASWCSGWTKVDLSHPTADTAANITTAPERIRI
jgi:hypothetical protein